MTNPVINLVDFLVDTFFRGEDWKKSTPYDLEIFKKRQAPNLCRQVWDPFSWCERNDGTKRENVGFCFPSATKNGRKKG